MKAVWKKHGVLYRGSLTVVTALMVAAGVLWGVSFIWYVGVGFPSIRQGQYRWVAVRGGGTFTHQSTAKGKLEAYFTRLSDDLKRDYAVSGVNWPDINWYKFRLVSDGTWNRCILFFPLWLPFVVLSVWPTIAFARRIRATPLTDICTACGYDLRGSSSGVCPECGKANPPPQSRSVMSDPK